MEHNNLPGFIRQTIVLWQCDFTHTDDEKHSELFKISNTDINFSPRGFTVTCMKLDTEDSAVIFSLHKPNINVINS